jgi:hypothetical protein
MLTSKPDGKIFYLAGPMTGLPGFNYDAFDIAAAELRAMGWDVINPTELDSEAERIRFRNSADGDLSQIPLGMPSYGDLIGRNMPYVLQADGFVLLPGWPESKGVMLELFAGWVNGVREFHYYRAPTTSAPVRIQPAVIFQRIVRYVSTI